MNLRQTINLVENYLAVQGVLCEDSQIDQNLITIATKCRNQIEKYVSSLRDDGKRYIPHKDSLDCFCAISSLYFFKVLKEKNIKSNFMMGTYNGDDHCWVEVAERIVDLTATQFDLTLPRIHITDINDSNYSVEYKGKAAIKKLAQWPKEQRFQSSMLAVLKSL